MLVVRELISARKKGIPTIRFANVGMTILQVLRQIPSVAPARLFIADETWSIPPMGNRRYEDAFLTACFINFAIFLFMKWPERMPIKCPLIRP